MKYFINKYVIFILSIGVFWRVFIPEPKVSLDYPYWYEESAKTLFNIPFVWRDVAGVDGFGQYLVSTLFTWPLLLLQGLLVTISVPYELVTKVFVFVILALAVWGIWRLLDYFKLGSLAKASGTALYVLNSYLLLLVDGGHLYLALAYSLMPWSFYLYRSYIENNFRRNLFKLAFVISILSVADIRAVVLLSLIIFIDRILAFLSSRSLRDTASQLAGGLFILVILTLVHAYWLYPALSSGSGLPASFTNGEQVSRFSYTDLGHSLFFEHPNWYTNVFGRISALRWEFFLLPLFVFLAPLVSKNNRWVGFWYFIAILSIFLTKGTNPPLGDIYPWLFSNVPGFFFFRDSSKFFFLLALSYSILLAFSVEFLSHLKQPLFKKISFIFSFFVVLYLVFLARPAFLGQMTGILSEPIYKSEYKQLASTLKSDHQFSRVLWLPRLAPLGYAGLAHPAVESIYLPEKRVFAQATIGSYETQNYLRQPYIGEILDISAIKYLVYPPVDVRRDDIHPDTLQYHKEFLEYLKNAPWVESVNNSSGIPLLETKKHQDKFFIPDTTWFIVGSDSVYKNAYEQELPFAQNAFIFLDEKLESGNWISDSLQGKIFIGTKSNKDLAATFLIKDQIFFPAEILGTEPNEYGWWKRRTEDFISWRDFLKNKYNIDNSDFDLGGGWGVAEGNLRLSLAQGKKGEVLLVRALVSPQGGKLVFKQNGKSVGEINTYEPKESYASWFEAVVLSQTGTVELETDGTLNVINAVAILPNGQWRNYLKKAESYMTTSQLKKELKNSNSQTEAKVTYKEINPTKYEIKVTGLQEPKTLVFSENFNTLWQLEGVSAIPVYSLLNGFNVEKDGEYTLKFVAQENVLPGLSVSILAWSVLVGGLLYFRLGKN